MNKAIISGYTGIFNRIVDETFTSLGASIYALGDEDRGELDLILLTPNCYTDVARILTNSNIDKVRIILPSLATDFITTLESIVTNFGESIEDLKWVFPTVSGSVSEGASDLQFVFSYYQNEEDSDIKFKFIPSGSTGKYDLLVEDGYKTRFFCQYLTAAEMASTFTDISFDEIHIPYNSGLGGSLTYLTALALNENYAEKLFPNTFLTVQDYYAATFDGLKAIPYTSATGEVEAFIPTDEKYMKIANIVRNQAMLSYVAGCTSVSAVSATYAIDMALQSNRTVFITNNYDIAQVETATVPSPAQVETATVVGTITTSGDATVTVTAAGMTGSPKAISVAVLENDTASDVAGKIRTALGLDADVTDMFTVSGATDKVILTANEVAINDDTLNIAIANDTCAGITEALTSANTTASSIVTSGNATVTVTAAGMTGSPKAISVAVEAGDDFETVASLIREALAADEDVTELFAVSGTGRNIVLTQIVPAANDATLNIAIADGTCDGITTAASSTNTTTGATAAKTTTVANVPSFAKLTINLHSITATTMTWFSGINWIGGVPSFSASRFHQLELVTVDAGTSWFGRVVGEWTIA